MQARRTFHSASAQYTYKFKVIILVLKILKKPCTTTTFENIVDDGSFNSAVVMQQRPCEAAGDRDVKLSVQPHQTQATQLAADWCRYFTEDYSISFVTREKTKLEYRPCSGSCLFQLEDRGGGMGVMVVLYDDGRCKGHIDRPVNTGAD
jgi:hypothetical protein